MIPDSPREQSEPFARTPPPDQRSPPADAHRRRQGAPKCPERQRPGQSGGGGARPGRRGRGRGVQAESALLLCRELRPFRGTEAPRARPSAQPSKLKLNGFKTTVCPH